MNKKNLFSKKKAWHLLCPPLGGAKKLNEDRVLNSLLVLPTYIHTYIRGSSKHRSFPVPWMQLTRFVCVSTPSPVYTIYNVLNSSVTAYYTHISSLNNGGKCASCAIKKKKKKKNYHKINNNNHSNTKYQLILPPQR